MIIVGRPRLLSNADVQRARALKRSGSKIRAIARDLGVSMQTITRRLSRPYKQTERRW